ncbi:hypothetical protein [Streptomyces fagopyri]|uniref:hypothetical protein n=1 Tax=Streptomyces fagopyri TaxID=2662397 RepID=UPI003F4D0FE8
MELTAPSRTKSAKPHENPGALSTLVHEQAPAEAEGPDKRTNPEAEQVADSDITERDPRAYLRTAELPLLLGFDHNLAAETTRTSIGTSGLTQFHPSLDASSTIRP